MSSFCQPLQCSSLVFLFERIKDSVPTHDSNRHESSANIDSPPPTAVDSPTKFTVSSVTDMKAPVPDTSFNKLPANINNTSNNIDPSISRVIQTLQFSLPPPAFYHDTRQLIASVHYPEMRQFIASACLSLPELTPISSESTEPTRTMPQHVFILPQGWTPGASFDDPSTGFKLFRLCVCGPNDLDQRFWVPHLLQEPRSDTENPQKMFNLFAPTLLASTRLFLHSLRIPSDFSISASMAPPEVPFADHRQATRHIQEEPGLVNIDAVEPLLKETIKYLEQQLAPRLEAVVSQQSFKTGHPPL